MDLVKERVKKRFEGRVRGMRLGESGMEGLRLGEKWIERGRMRKRREREGESS